MAEQLQYHDSPPAKGELARTEFVPQSAPPPIARSPAPASPEGHAQVAEAVVIAHVTVVMPE